MSEHRVVSRALPASFEGSPVPSAKEARRSALFRETPFEMCERVVLGTAWAFKPKRIGILAPLFGTWLADLATGRRAMPDVETLGSRSEFAGIAYDLSMPTLLAAYRRGLFPHGHFGPAKWFSPAKRAVLLLNEFHISARLRSMMRQEKYTVTFDRDFEGVIKGCAGRRQGRWHLTWITPRIMWAYAALYDEGHVHCFEVWNEQGMLAGGGYGVIVGRAFVIESQFFRESNASKIGFSVLAWHLAGWGFTLCDNKWLTATTAQMGFKAMPRAEYLRLLAEAVDGAPEGGRWETETGPKIVADWRPDEARMARSA